MKHRLFHLLATLGIGLMASCYPYPEDPPAGPTTAGQTFTSEEQQKIQEQRDRMRQEAERQQQAQLPGSSRTETPPPPVDPPRRNDYQFATPVPGKEGFVFSPYNNKVVDVRDIPSGTLVQDPTYPPSEKKYFRVP